MRNDTQGLLLNISAVEKDTGLSKDVLRMWERRYGFPRPGRDDNGERQYSATDVGKLRAMKRLMDVGLRPGKIIGLTLTELNAIADARTPARPSPLALDIEHDVLAMLRSHDLPGLQHTLANQVMRQGLQRFVLDTITPLNRAVGDAWMRGDLQVFEEHLYTEQLQVALRAAINASPRQSGTPRMLLTTLPAELHGLGLLMVEAMLVPEGVHCISLGPQTPLEDIRRAAIAHQVHIVALSFSAAFPVRQAVDGLATLRRELPAQMTLWAGGELTRRVRKTMPGIMLIPDLAWTVNALHSWRTHHVPQPV
ncbi:MAG: MerR family transcriptional regulator [Burkholderiales bacterium]|nr:MerR family transcriptional regulator [Burkholderiales bacterium]